MKFGISLLRLNPARWAEASVEAEHIGYESIWMSEHLVLPTHYDQNGYPEGRLPIGPMTPVFDPPVYLAYLAGLTTTIRLGTYIYQLGLRHPFVVARAVTTLDVVSGGRVELGVGIGWFREEWSATGFEFESRGDRLDEAVAVCKRLWDEPTTTHHGTFYSFPEVAFEPKPVQRPHPPIHVGGESPRAMRRAIATADGWIGMHHDARTARARVQELTRLAEAADRPRLEITVAAHAGVDVIDSEWDRSGVDRIILAPWKRSSDAIDGMRRFAAAHL